MPDLTTALQQQIRRAAQHKQALEIIGGHSKAFLGHPPQGEPLSLLDHSGIIDYEPVELVLTARAGTCLTEIQAALDEHQQMLACDPPLFNEQSTLGGTLACHLSGPGRPWSGSVRDHVLGVHLITGSGKLLRFGGQVMKNVAGYDVSRLQAGAMGTLGVMTQISLKVMPKPESQLTLIQTATATQAIQWMNRYASQAKPLSAACWLAGTLYLRLSGAETALQATAKQWDLPAIPTEQAHQFWADLRDQRLDFFTHAPSLWRFSVSPTSPLPQALSRTATNDPATNCWLLDWGGAQRWYRGTPDAHLENLVPHAEAMKGQVTLFKGQTNRREQAVMHPLPIPLQALQKKLKQQFDPHDILNRGRLYPWL